MIESLYELENAVDALRNRTIVPENMSKIEIVEEINKAYEDYLNMPIDCDFGGSSILRRHTYPYLENEFSGKLAFAAGYQAAMNKKEAL